MGHAGAAAASLRRSRPLRQLPEAGGTAVRGGAGVNALALHPSGFLALSPKNRRFLLDGELAAYRDHGRHRFVFGGVASERMLRALVEASEADGRQVVAVQVREEQVALFRHAGFGVNQLGTSYSLSLDRFSLGGGARMK